MWLSDKYLWNLKLERGRGCTPGLLFHGITPSKSAHRAQIRRAVPRLTCQWPSVSPQLRPSVLPTGGHLFSPLVAMSSPHDQVGVATVDAKPSPEGEA